MARILLIETATARLSTALSEDGTVTAFRVCDEPRMQASLTAPYVQEVLQEKGLSVKDLDAVCVGRGPGSGKGKTAGRGENGQLSRAGGGKRAQNIVGFVALAGHDFVAEQAEQLFERRHLACELGRHALARSLVAVVRLMAEGGSL